MDSLLYNYSANTNKLKNVIDLANDVNTKLGDFRSSSLYMEALGSTKTTSATDYAYDDNGNMVKDKNKDMETFAGADGIEYNYLNLPKKITVKASGSGNKGTIEYVYDAAGNKLAKTTTEGSVVTTTLYMYGNYVNDVLQFLPQEEGRIRYNADSARWEYDYFLKDHLGNVRMMLTDANKTDMYPAATMEDKEAEALIYGNINETNYPIDKISGYPTDEYTDPNEYVARVKAEDHLIGPNITLKVMAGDKVNIRASSWYKKNDWISSNNYIVTDLLYNLTTGIANQSGGKVLQTQLDGSSSPVPNGLASFLTNQSSNNYDDKKPMAYVNWILFDEQFKYVASSSGSEQVGDDDEFKVHTLNDLPMDKNGYLFVYVSNASTTQPVYFDNLQVTHVRGPILEETHYYPYGLTMAGISSKAVGDIENKKKYQLYELNTTLDINLYESFYRSYDSQLGKFWQVDPKPTLNESQYAAMGNNPLRYTDPLGDIIEGSDESSASNLQIGIQFSFKDEKVRKLFRLEKNGKTFKQIGLKAFTKATKNLKGDELALASAYRTAINDESVHRVTVVTSHTTLTPEQKDKFGIQNVLDLDVQRGGGKNISMAGGSESIILQDPSYEHNGLYRNATDQGGYRAGTPSFGELIAHEVLGHGLSRTNDEQNMSINGVLMGNLYLRAQGITSYYNDGSQHAGHQHLGLQEGNAIPAMYVPGIIGAYIMKLADKILGE